MRKPRGFLLAFTAFTLSIFTPPISARWSSPLGIALIALSISPKNPLFASYVYLNMSPPATSDS
tara:strand:+ start:329 stop:520 length:192 start_codon:yes stop_codon:yes gene_type:complete